ncbi:hypothetical protein OUZ56_022435 [Daphnia magna]|uniref:Uncharacterized protein n=1 Tax=Daphnia magna TaxID=35525 RepID=A0ABR0AWE2_9CRUS|nr:hypothetical protein OUZ56_022435 [Daphnia magna]
MNQRPTEAIPIKDVLPIGRATEKHARTQTGIAIKLRIQDKTYVCRVDGKRRPTPFQLSLRLQKKLRLQNNMSYARYRSGTQEMALKIDPIRSPVRSCILSVLDLSRQSASEIPLSPIVTMVTSCDINKIFQALSSG